MQYEKREKYIVPSELRQEVLELLLERKDESGIQSKKIRDLLIYMKPLTKSRWSKYLTFSEMDKYLVVADSDDLGI